VASGLGTVGDPGTPLVGQGLLLHAAKIGQTAQVAPLAEARTVTQTVVVIHSFRSPCGGTGVTGVAAHARTCEQLGFVGNMVDRLPDRSRVDPGRRSGVANLALSRYAGRDVLYRRPKRGAGVARIALRRGRNVRSGGLLLRIFGQVRAIVAVRALAIQAGVIHRMLRPVHG